MATEYGVTANGFNRKTFNVLLDQLETRARAVFGAPNLDVRDPAGFLASVYLPMLEQVEDLWSLGENVYNAPDPRRSTGQSFAAVAALRGVTRKPAERGTYNGPEFTFDAAVPGTIARGDIRFNVAGQGENIWINSNDFTIGAGGIYIVEVESELPGSTKQLSSGATIEIIEGPGELSLITIPNDEAISGTDLEDESAWRTRAEAAINEEQTKVGAAVEDVQGVVAARVIETAGYIRVVLNDNPGGADDDEIAQAIYDSKCQGVLTLGDESGTALDELGEEITISFDRVQLIEGYASVTVTAPEGASTAAIKQAVQDNQPTLGGQTVVWAEIFAAVQNVEGVTDTTELLIDTTDPPTESSNLPSDPDEQIRFLDANIDVTVNS